MNASEQPLSDRMDKAADILVEASRRYYANRVSMCDDPEFTDWRPANLRSAAETFRREDDELIAVRDQVVTFLVTAKVDSPVMALRYLVDAMMARFNITPKPAAEEVIA